jgi:DNA-binding MarR family transcriptional regulator
LANSNAMALPPTWTLFGDDHLPHRVLLLAKMLDRQTARQLQDNFGLTLAEWRVLAFIGSAGPASAADVGSGFEVDRAEVSRAVARLLVAGLVERTPDIANRKRHLLELTQAGRDVFERARDQRQGYFRTIMQDLDADALAGLRSALDSIAERVGSGKEPAKS